MENSDITFNNFSVQQLAEALDKVREFRNITSKDVCQLLDIPTSKLTNYEKGKYAPTLPEIESLAYIYDIPINALFSPEELEELIREPDKQKLGELRNIRRQIISTQINIAFDNSGQSIKELAANTGLPLSRLNKYLSNSLEIPFDDLLVLTKALRIDIQQLFDSQSSLGQWQMERSRQLLFSKLPEEIKAYVVTSANSSMIAVTEKIRALDKPALRALIDALEKVLQMDEFEGDATDQGF